VTRVVIFRASDRAEVGPHAHQPAPETEVPPGGTATVLTTLCGQLGIGRVYERESGVTYGLCRAIAGEHPGRRGKQQLRKLLEVPR
jgi:hypothetical protein